MFNVRLAGGHLYGKQLFTWLSLVVSLMASFVLSLFPLDVLDEIWDLIESVSEGVLTYSSMPTVKVTIRSKSCVRNSSKTTQKYNETSQKDRTLWNVVSCARDRFLGPRSRPQSGQNHVLAITQNYWSKFNETSGKIEHYKTDCPAQQLGSYT